MDLHAPDSAGRPGTRPGAFLLLLLCAAVLLAGNGRTGVFDRDEARFALAVREMATHGEWVLPTNWGEPRYHKPILAYALALGSAGLFGAGEFAWRLPSALAGLLTLAVTVALAHRRHGARVALLAGAVLGTFLVFVLEHKILTADASLLASTTLAFTAWLELREGRPRPWRLVLWVALALGILAKGVNLAFLASAGAALAFLHLAPGSVPRRVIGLLVCAAAVAAAVPPLAFLGPVLCVVAALACYRGARPGLRASWRASGAAWGLPLCLALVGVWLVPAVLRSRGAFLSEGVGHHMLARTTSAFEGHRGFPGYYLATAVLAFFPWAAFVPAALANAWRERDAFLLAWVLGPWALLEGMASKLPHYALVGAPALAVLIALELERRRVGLDLRSARLRRLELALFLGPCLVLVAAGVALGFVPVSGVRLAGGLLVIGALLLAALGAGAVLRARARGLAALVAGTFLLELLLAGVVVPALEPLRIARPAAAAVARLAHPGESLHLVHWRPASLGCALPLAVPVVQDQEAVTRALSEGRAGLFLVEGERLEALQSAHPGGWQTLEVVRVPASPLSPTEVVLLRRSERPR